MAILTARDGDWISRLARIYHDLRTALRPISVHTPTTLTNSGMLL
jgi:hypothetical protein